jgi:hypothetical protein
MAKLVDALGLGSNEFIRAGSSPVLRKITYFYSKKLMKSLYLRQKKAFPLATSLKKANQQWNPMRTLSKAEKKLFKNKFSFFSMEYGRSLPKRLLWQIAIAKPGTNPGEVDSGVTHESFSFSNGVAAEVNLKQKKNSRPGPPVTPFQQNWAVFRFVFFGKMWMLNNPSLVPGLVWPVKRKKTVLAKLRAWKAMSQLVGQSNLHFLKQNLQKLWNLPSHLIPSLWSLASGLDSLKTNLVLKSGLAGNLPSAYHLVSRGHYFLNGLPCKKSLGFNYPGDVISLPMPTLPQTCVGFKNPSMGSGTEKTKFLKPAHLFPFQEPGPAWVLSRLFTHGPTRPSKKGLPAQCVSPFLWMASFYHQGKALNLLGQRPTLKRRSYKKTFTARSSPPFRKNYSSVIHTLFFIPLK